jgi:hypothetical protein
VLVIVLMALALAFAGCGNGGSNSAKHLSTAETARVGGAQSALDSYCRRLRLSLAGRGAPLAPSYFEGVEGRIEDLIALARNKPKALYGQQEETLPEVLGDMAESLQATNCSTRLEQDLEQGLATLR